MSSRGLLRHARRSAGLSQRELAKRTGIAQPTIARIERGQVSPRARTLERLLESCGFGLALETLPEEGVDRSSIVELLRLSPEERLRVAAEEARNLESVLSG